MAKRMRERACGVRVEWVIVMVRSMATWKTVSQADETSSNEIVPYSGLIP